MKETASPAALEAVFSTFRAGQFKYEAADVAERAADIATVKRVVADFEDPGGEALAAGEAAIVDLAAEILG